MASFAYFFESVETITLENNFEDIAFDTAQLNKVFPLILIKFLFLIDFDPDLAGITAKIFFEFIRFLSF